MRDLVLAWMWFSSARDVGVYVTFMSFSACRSTLFVCRTVATLCASNHSVFWSFRCVRNASCCATSRFCAMACVCLALWRYPFEFGVTRGSGCRAVFCLHTVSFVTWCTCFATWLRSRPNIAGLQCRPRWWNSGADVLHKPRDVNGCFLALCVRGDGVRLSIVHGVQWCVTFASVVVRTLLFCVIPRRQAMCVPFSSRRSLVALAQSARRLVTPDFELRECLRWICPWRCHFVKCSFMRQHAGFFL